MQCSVAYNFTGVLCSSATTLAPPRPQTTAPKRLPPMPAPQLEPPAAPKADPDAEPSSTGGSLAEQRLKKGLRPGQLDTDIGAIGHRMRELAGRRSYLRNFWYAAGEWRKVPSHNVHVRS
jgi:hypothetical protein